MTTDNRNYTAASWHAETRPEYPFIIKSIPTAVSVVDLGCGDGTLLQLLKQEKEISGTGVEISADGVQLTMEKGFTALQASIDAKLPFTNKQFDFAICNVTMQMVMYPETLFSEITRIAKESIITFPNFGYVSNRLHLLFNGTMPTKTLFAHTWYNTGHIHQFSYNDFVDFITSHPDVSVAESFSIPTNNKIIDSLAEVLPSIFSLISFFHLRHTNASVQDEKTNV